MFSRLINNRTNRNDPWASSSTEPQANGPNYTELQPMSTSAVATNGNQPSIQATSVLASDTQVPIANVIVSPQAAIPQKAIPANAANSTIPTAVIMVTAQPHNENNINSNGIINQSNNDSSGGNNVNIHSNTGNESGNNPTDSSEAAAPVPVSNAVPSICAALNPKALPKPAPRAENASEAEIYERERVLVILYQRSRFVRWMTILDLVFIVLFVTGTWYGPLAAIVAVIGPVTGYWGARIWKQGALVLYTVFLYIEIALNVAIIIVFLNWGFWELHFIHIIVASILARYTINLAQYIHVFNDADRQFLQSSAVIQGIRKFDFI